MDVDVQTIDLDSLEQEFEAFTQPPEEISGFVSEEDKGKEAVITRVGFAETKYGRKFRIVLKFDDGVEKSVLLSKTLARNFKEAMANKGYTSLRDWIGKKVKIDMFAVIVRGQTHYKAIPIPL